MIKILTKLTAITFLQEVKTELGKVVWPTRQQTLKLTLIVILVSVIVGLFVGGLDFIFAKLSELFLK